MWNSSYDKDVMIWDNMRVSGPDLVTNIFQMSAALQ